MGMKSAIRGTVAGAALFVSLWPAVGSAGEEAGRKYAVTGNIVQIFSEIPAKPVGPLKAGNPGITGLIYGNVVSALPVPGNKDFLEVIPADPPAKGSKVIQLRQFVSARGLVAETAYQPRTGRYIIARGKVNLSLLPRADSRDVLVLFKGEVLESSGVAVVDGTSWVRFEFASERSDGFRGIQEQRVGWIPESDLVQLKPDLDQGTLSVGEVPMLARDTDISLAPFQAEDIALQGSLINPLNAAVAGSPIVDDMVDLYHGNKGAVFITSDLYTHSLHLLFDRMLQDIEQYRIKAALGEMSVALLADTIPLYAREKNPEIKKALARNIWFFGVACRLLAVDTSKVPPELKEDIEKEATAIESAGGAPGADVSAYLPRYQEDYSQYKVRGHYDLNDDLKAYFRVMMHFGRKTFILEEDSPTLSAMIIARMVRARHGEKYGRIRDVIDYLVGKSDDWGPYEYARVMDEVLGGTNVRISEMARPENLARFRERARKGLPSQKIISQKTGMGGTLMELDQALSFTSGFKFIGQRYTMDAAIFQRLVAPEVGTNDNPKNLPTGLELMGILGSKEAESQLESFMASVAGYPAAYAGVKADFGSALGDKKAETAYSRWLGMLAALFRPAESRQKFANTERWGFKNLNTALGSWTELKHDTVLYGEQSYAEMGGGGDEELPPVGYLPPRVKGYVEPNPVFFNRLVGLTDIILSSVSRAGMMTEDFSAKLGQFRQLTVKSRDLALKEVGGGELTEQDYETIYELPHEFDERLLFPANMNGGTSHLDPDLLKMAVIADVATDAFNNKVLLEGVGFPQEILVVVKDYWGGTRLARGYIYSYYEFANDSRWTDKEWRERVYSGSNDVREREPAWYQFLR